MKTNSTRWIVAGIALAALGVGVAQLAPVVTHAARAAEQQAETADAIIGKPAPNFTLPDQSDKPVKLSAHKGKWVVLAFYPADMTPGCTIQNESYSRHIGEFAPKHVVVYTISTQDTASKKAFCTKSNLKHTLLSDVGGKVAKEYGAIAYGSSYANRWTYYVAPDGTVKYVDKNIAVGTAAEDTLARLDLLAKDAK